MVPVGPDKLATVRGRVLDTSPRANYQAQGNNTTAVAMITGAPPAHPSCCLVADVTGADASATVSSRHLLDTARYDKKPVFFVPYGMRRGVIPSPQCPFGLTVPACRVDRV